LSRKEKLIKRLQARPRDFKWDELQRLLEGLGYELARHGKTGGSRRRFLHKTAATITLHKPHPGNIVKIYVIDDILSVLKQENLI